ncbi:hypothetical protein FOZ60_007709 [Perkinsus olseni]|uniref:Uncharacterized protein n=1 Tax=Perkinsus olseni TaxID=32597 RepID=A0A7J6NKY7_PEROL|nr:hypothetical protein FOZ60_007709 [Perkinsus olseni]
MTRAAAAGMLMLAPIISAAPTEESLSLSVEEGFVKINLDGQEVELLLDSAYPFLSVLDGEWYEKEFGEGACMERRTGCYFCPTDDPCEFKDYKKLPTGVFADNSTIVSEIRWGSLSLNNRTISKFPFRVSRYAVRRNDPLRPWGHFGISMVPPDSKTFRRWPGDESLLDSLMRHRIIGRPTYTLLSKAQQLLPLNYISGELTLGDAIGYPRSEYKIIKFFHSPYHHRAYAKTWVSSVKLFDTNENLLTKQRFLYTYPRSFMASIDTGTNTISLPYPHLHDDIVRVIRRGMKRDGYDDRQIAAMRIRFEDDDDFLYVRKEVFDYLPVLGLQLEDGSKSISIKIHPKHYTWDAGSGVLALLLIYRPDSCALGTQFFRAYSVHVDYTTHKIALFEN